MADDDGLFLEDSYPTTGGTDYLDRPAPTIRAGRAWMMRRGKKRGKRRGSIVLDDGGSYAGLGSRDFDDAPAPTIRSGGQMTVAVDGQLPAPDPAKPPYRVPSMAEIAATPWNGWTVASTFAGCGGSSLGYRMAGFRVGWANEFVEHAADTYRANAAPGTVVDTRDVRDVKGAEILDACGGRVDVLDGSPPCQPFSTSGKRDRTWGQERQYGDHAQRADDLFYEYARLVGEVRPRVFVAENVTGLVKGTAKGYFKLIFRALEEQGYRVEARVLDAQWLGVPQARQRVIFMGVRDDLGLDPRFPAPLPYRYSMADALPHLRRVTFDTRGANQSAETDEELDAPARTVTAGGQAVASAYHFHVEDEVRLEYGPSNVRGASVEDPAPTVMARGIGGVREYQATVRRGTAAPFDSKGRGVDPDEPVPTILAGSTAGNGPYGFVVEEEALPDGQRLDGYAIGEEWDRVGPGGKSDRYQNLVRPDPDGPVPTVTAAGGTPGFASVAHPTERRKFHIAELLRLCGFPDDFAMHGSYTEQWARLGNSVPPPMMAAVAREVDAILAACP